MKTSLIKHSFPKTAKTFAVKNPANNKTIATLPSLETAHVKSAIKKAKAAFDSWKNKNAWERADLLKKWHALILQNKAELAEIMHQESGKLLAESQAEIEYAASFIEWAAEEAKRVYGEIIPMPNSNRGFVTKQPIGVVAAITPWNFPAAMITRKISPALAAGCTVVCKPAEATPLTAIALHNLARQAGFPDGVFELVIGDAKTIGKELTSNSAVKKISFTGSTEVGKLLMVQAAASVKKITMELGGNAPFIVFDDADLDKAVDGAIKSRFRFSGQTCICANRFLVQEKIYDAFAKKLTEKVKSLKIAPLINQAAIKKVEGLLKSAGGKILCGGKSKGNFFEPTVVCDIKKPSKIFATEIFGPVAAIYKFKSFDDAIRLANDSEYGLAAYVFGKDLNVTLKAAESLEFGMVGINDVVISATHSPFGGMKQSGIGREGSHYGIDEFLEVKFISVG